MSKETPDSRLGELETALARLTPSGGGLDRDALLFRAGKASARQRRWPWQAATGALALLAASLGAVLVLRPQPERVREIVVVHVPVQAPVADQPPESPRDPRPGPSAVFEEPTSAPTDYLRLRQQVVRWGPDVLPHTPPLQVSYEAPTIEDLLGLPPRTPEQPSLFRWLAPRNSGGPL